MSCGAHGAEMTTSHLHQPTRHAFTRQLDNEWERLRTRPRVVSVVRSWGEVFEARVGTEVGIAITRLNDLDELLELTQRGCAADVDAVLLLLVELAREEQLAGRILVQRLLPGLVAAGSKHRSHHDWADPAELAVGSLWIALRNYDVDRRQRHVAASLISDAIFAAFRRERRLRSAGELLTQPADFDEAVAPTRLHPFEELAAVIAEARRSAVPTSDLDLVRHLVAAASPGRVARERNITARSVRNHRHRAIERIRDAVAA